MTAEVAGQTLRSAMERHSETAVRTLANMTAQLAEHRGGEPPPIQEEDRLLIELETAGDRHLERRGEPSIRLCPLSLKA